MNAARGNGPRSTVFWARWGFFIVAGVLGALLVVSTVSSYLGSRALLGTLEAGQRASVEQALRANLGEVGRPPTPEKVGRAFAAAEPLGLRYLALLGPEGEVSIEVGESVAPNPIKSEGPARVGDRMRFVGTVHRGPPKRPHPEDRLGSGSRAPRGHRPPKGPPPRFVLEVETSYARELQLRSARDATIGLAVSVALILGAFVFGRLATRTERIATELRDQRELASLGEMSAVLAHELRNPLASMKGNAELLAEGLVGDERRGRQAQRVYEAAARLERLTEDLLDFVRAGKVHRELCEPRALCRRAIEASGVADVHIEDSRAPDQWQLDEDRLMQALVNLLRNADQANEGGATVEVKLSSEAGDLVFEVRDHGAGVPSEEREHIFEPFVTTREDESSCDRIPKAGRYSDSKLRGPEPCPEC
jgi:two-component system sensor histidine kinase HydH